MSFLHIAIVVADAFIQTMHILLAMNHGASIVLINMLVNVNVVEIFYTKTKSITMNQLSSMFVNIVLILCG